MLLVAPETARRLKSVLVAVAMLGSGAGALLPSASAVHKGENQSIPVDYEMRWFALSLKSGENDTFVSSGDTLVASMYVHNFGETPVHKTPIYIFARWEDPAMGTVLLRECKLVNPIERSKGRLETISLFLDPLQLGHDLEESSTWENRSHLNVSVYVNTHAPNINDVPSKCKEQGKEFVIKDGCSYFLNTPSCPREGTPVEGLPDVPRIEPNNTASRIVVLDRRPNFHLTHFEICRTTQSTCVHPGDPVGGSPTDVATYNPPPANDRFFVRFHIENKEGTYNLSTHPDNHSAKINFPVRMKGTNLNRTSAESNVVLGEVRFNTSDAKTPAGAVVNMTGFIPFNTYERAGVYRITLEADPPKPGRDHGEIRETSEAAAKRTLIGEVDVRAADLKGAIDKSTLRTDPKDPHTYTSQGLLTLTVNLNVTNAGRFIARNETATGPNFLWRLYLDEVKNDNEHFINEWDLRELAVNGVAKRTVTINGYDGTSFTGDKSGKRNITPGQHKLILVVDPTCPDAGKDDCPGRGQIIEFDETNNKDVVTFFTKDAKAPKVTDFTVNWTKPDDEKPIDLTIRRGETVPIRVNVTDDDAFFSVVLVVKEPGTNATIPPLQLPMPKSKTPLESLFLLNRTFTKVGLHELSINASDPSLNNASSNKFQLKVDAWPIQTKAEKHILYETPTTSKRTNPLNDTTFPYNPDDAVIFELIVNASETGVLPENTTKNKRIKVQYPGSSVWQEEPFHSEYSCPLVPLPGTTCTPSNLFTYGIILNQVGRHNVSILVTDKSGEIRVINRTFVVKGTLPVLESVSALPASVNAGDTVSGVQAVVSDDFGIEKVHLVWKKKTGNYTANLTMNPIGGDVNRGTFELNVTTGFDAMVDHGGAFNVTYAAVNIYGEWNTTTYTVSINDTKAPVLLKPSVSPNPQEIDSEVKFRVQATDNTNFTVWLTVTKGPSEKLGTFKMERIGSSHNYTYNRTFSQAADYTYVMEAIDSVGNNATKQTGIFTVAPNLAPRFEIRQPSYENARGKFTGPVPRFEFVVYDRDGVVENTINVSAWQQKGEAAPTEFALELVSKEESPEPLRGFLLVYRAKDVKLSHNTVVILKVSATDNSPASLSSNLSEADGTFRVDATPPVSRKPEFQGPTYRDLDTDPLVIGPKAAFKLSADENAGDASTEVASIQFNVIRSFVGTKGPFVFPKDQWFEFSSLFAAPYNVPAAGPGEYQLQFWATDAVGNQEPLSAAKPFPVIFDYTPPSPDPLTPKRAKHLNVSWADDFSNVSSVVASYNVNGGPFKPLPLKEASGVWSGSIAEGTKGDRVCYYYEARDGVLNVERLGNATAPFHCYEVQNNSPVFKLLAPGDEARVSGTVNIDWSTSDPDGDEVRIKIFYGLAGRANLKELASPEPGASRFAWNTRTVPDGTYQLQVQATDGQLIAFGIVNVTVQNEATAIRNQALGADKVRPGEPFLVTALVTKAGASVEARIFRDGKLVDSVPMRDDGKEGDEAASDNVYSARIIVKEAGAYSVEIVAQYRDGGEVKTYSPPSALTFTAKLTAADVFSQFATLWAALVVLVAACAGVGGYALFRKWRT